MATQPISEAQLAANRANAQLSSGPVTEAGRAVSSQNAIKHGLTSKTILLPGEDPAAFRALSDMWSHLFGPKTDFERSLIDSIVSSDWRLARIKRLEAAIQAKGHMEFSDKYQDQPEQLRQTLIEADVYLKYEKQLKNLALQESRLRRHIEKDKWELFDVQARRAKAEEVEAARAAFAEFVANPQTPAPKPNGFVFSTGQKPPAQSSSSAPTDRAAVQNTQPQPSANHAKGV